MPTYSYACTQCTHRFDAVQSFSDPSLTVCPECQGALRKLYNSIGVTFNGSGFYRTDSRAAAGSGGGSSQKSTADAGSSGGSASQSSGGASASTGTSS